MFNQKELKQKIVLLEAENVNLTQAIKDASRAFDEHIAQIDERVANLESRIEKYDSSFEEFVNQKRRKESDEEPFLNVISQSFSAEHGIELKLDWNKAMINYLRRNGYQGLDEDQIVQRYMADLLKDQVDNSIPA